MSKTQNRPDRDGVFQTQYKNNRKKILASQDICAICGRPVDKRIKYPEPFSPTVDHIIPVAKGGHPADINNLQLAHFICNRAKADKVFERTPEHKVKAIGNQDLPLSVDWAIY